VKWHDSDAVRLNKRERRYVAVPSGHRKSRDAFDVCYYVIEEDTFLMSRTLCFCNPPKSARFGFRLTFVDRIKRLRLFVWFHLYLDGLIFFQSRQIVKRLSDRRFFYSKVRENVHLFASVLVITARADTVGIYVSLPSRTDLAQSDMPGAVRAYFVIRRDVLSVSRQITFYACTIFGFVFIRFYCFALITTWQQIPITEKNLRVIDISLVASKATRKTFLNVFFCWN